jgi:hypothetical protein
MRSTLTGMGTPPTVIKEFLLGSSLKQLMGTYHLHCCKTSPELIMLLTRTFNDVSEFEGRDWKQMAIFIVDMIYSGVVYDDTATVNLEETIADLKSLRGRLTRRFRPVKAY